jgi:hypothetical protein
MNLIKEVYQNSEFDIHEKEFSETGFLLKERFDCLYKKYRKEYLYDQDNRLIKILETDFSDGTELVYEHTYEYDSANYRITTILKEQIGESQEINFHSAEKASKRFKINEIKKIEERKFIDGKILSESRIDIVRNTFEKRFLTYHNNDLAKEIIQTNDYTECHHYKYENNKIVEKKGMIDDTCFSKTKFIYLDDLLIKEEIFSYNIDSEEYLKFFTNYNYDENKKLTRTEYYGRYDSDYELYKVEEIIQKDNIVIEKGFDNGSMDLGFFNLEALNNWSQEEFYKESPERFIPNKPRKTTSDLSKCYYHFESHYLNLRIIVPTLQEGLFHCQNNQTEKSIVKRVSFNPQDRNQVHSREYYHYEKNRDGFLELEINFTIDDNFEYNHHYTKKYYYA